jgi:transcriptional regulator with XRE-family HTH domain
MVYQILGLPRLSQSNVDPEFWERLRKTLESYLKSSGLKQKELAPQLGIDPTTLSNFLNGQSNSINGLAVALACTFVELSCSGVRIGRTTASESAETESENLEEQLLLEFDESFEFHRESERPILVLRKSPGRQEIMRLSMRRIS